MNILSLSQSPAPELSRQLAQFERRFVYPLGEQSSFTISHGDDYPRFFRSMGEARCLFATRNEQVIGSLGIAIRTLHRPHGRAMRVAYVGDLKIDPSSPRGYVLLRLAAEALAWARPQVEAAYGVVMGGTARLPDQYSGRMGIPAFAVLADLRILRLDTAACGEEIDSTIFASDPRRGEEKLFALAAGSYLPTGGDGALRSATSPQWLVHPSGLAVGRLEDTLAGKRLFDSNGNEMISAHLASFAWQSSQAGAELLRAAGAICRQRGIPAIFTAVNHCDEPALCTALGPWRALAAPARVFGVGLQHGLSWNISTSEI